MDTEYRRNRKDWFRLVSFLGWQELYVFPQEGVLTTPPYMGALFMLPAAQYTNLNLLV